MTTKMPLLRSKAKFDIKHPLNSIYPWDKSYGAENASEKTFIFRALMKIVLVIKYIHGSR